MYLFEFWFLVFFNILKDYNLKILVFVVLLKECGDIN